MTTTVTEVVQLSTITCGSCGVTFAIPSSLYRELLDHHDRSFWCPNGHQRHFVGQTETDRLQAELDRVKARARHVEDQRDAADRSNRALRGVITRQKRRAAAGVCPCCHRSFQALADHMATQHPDYATQDVTE